MPVKKLTEYSEYEARQMNVHVPKGENVTDVYAIECLGSIEESSEVRSVTKKCRGVTSKSRTMGTGSGTVKVSAHLPFELYEILHGMNSDDLAEGVHGYGYYSVHPEVALTVDCYDEDAVEKFKAYPRCVVSTGPARKIENGADTVAECELTFAYMPDENSMGIYEALAADLSDEIKTKWMSEFKPSLMLAPSA